MSKVIILCFSAVLALTLSCKSSLTEPFRCSDHDWQSVQDLVFLYLEEDMQTAMVMQAQSAEYKISAAADFALTFDEAYPDSVNQLLRKLEECDVN